MIIRKPTLTSFIIGIALTVLLFIINIDSLSYMWWLFVIFIISDLATLSNYFKQKKAYEQFVMSESNIPSESLNSSAPLAAPCTVEVVYIMSSGSPNVNVIHNGIMIGGLNKGNSVRFITNVTQNRVQIGLINGAYLQSADFIAAPAGYVRLELDYKLGQLAVTQNIAGMLVNQPAAQQPAEKPIESAVEPIEQQPAEQSIVQPAPDAAADMAGASLEEPVSNAAQETGSSLTEPPALSGSAATTSAETIGKLVDD